MLWHLGWVQKMSLGTVLWMGIGWGLLGGFIPAHAQTTPDIKDIGGELRVLHTTTDSHDPHDTHTLGEAELRASWRWMHANALVSDSKARFNELHAGADLGAWQLSAGKKIVSWDVGYGFRPNDVVQQEVRRSLLITTLEGHPLLQAEHFGAEQSTSMVWVQPQQLNDPPERQRGAQESALAIRHYLRQGALDLHGFARLGQHTGTSLGAAAAWIATNTLELHASGRWLERFDVLVGPPSPSHATTQVLVGAQWTGDQQQSLLVEAWHDGTAPDVLQARDNFYARLAWQVEDWQLSLDALQQTADRSLITSAGLQWQGNMWKVNLAWRHYGGPSGAVVLQQPSQHLGLLALTRAF